MNSQNSIRRNADAKRRTLSVVELGQWRADAATAGQEVAVVAGTFDMLQPGNVNAVRQAMQQTGRVCVVLEPDSTAADRPRHSLADRAEFVSYLRDVAVTVSFSPATAQEFLEQIRPFTFFSCPACPEHRRGEHAADRLTNAIEKTADSRQELPFLPGCSSNDVIEAIREGRTPIKLRGSRVEGREKTGKKDRKVVTVNGCFDVLHLGHLRFLAQARAMGDELIVLLNDDDSVRNYKGPDRPVFPVQFRTQALLALNPVSRVRPFNEDDPLKVLAELRPDIHVKGGSYDKERAQKERKLVESWGGRLEFCPMTEGYSTSEMIGRMIRGGRPTAEAE